MADELGLDEIRARALNNIGAARVASGDPGGVGDLDEALELATRLNDAEEIIRAYNNRGTMLLLLGRLVEAVESIREAHRLAQHFGQRGFVRWAEGGPLIGPLWAEGKWDEIVERATAFIDSLGSEGHYQAASAYLFRAQVRAGRGEDAAAAEDVARTLELARPVGDPQLTGVVLLGATFVYMTIGDTKRAAELLDEAFELIRGLDNLGWVAVELHSLAWVAEKLGRGEELLALVADEQLESPWLLAGRAAAAGDFVRAADIFGEIGDASLEAFYRLCAAEALVAAGRRAEADEQLRPALAFYRGVGATRYVREGEALLAASA